MAVEVPMNPGKYPLRAVFTLHDDDFDEIGNPSDLFIEIGRAWVSLRPVSGREYLTASGEHSNVSHRLDMFRPSFDILNSMVVTISGRTFEVDHVMDGPSQREIFVMCVEKRV
jgi:SPP1 family predicted phage head-tail adaptor